MAWVILAIVVVVAIVAIGAMWARIRRTRSLQDRFGPEYDRTVGREGDPGTAEADLRRREKEHAKLDIRPLSPAARERYAERWRATQAQFVDEPSAAVDEADRLITEAMREEGYPVDDFDRRADDISVDYPDVVENYRVGHRIAAANASDGASTEDMRQAMVHYRALFDRLTGIEQEPAMESRR